MSEENETESKNNEIPNFNIPTQMDYTKGFDFKPLNGSQVLREVITDTYVTASNNEDEMVKRIDDAMNILKGKIHGFAGFLSFCYLQLTLFYIMKKYDLCLKSSENILSCVDAIEKFIFTRSYDEIYACGVEMRNYAFGESDADLKNTVKYIHDSWNVAKIIHSKAASFESGFSLIVSEIMLHGYNNQIGLMREDCFNLRDLVNRIKVFIENERNSEMSSNDETEFMSIENIKKENKEENNGND